MEVARDQRSMRQREQRLHELGENLQRLGSSEPL